MEGVRADKWLWSVRLFKTRSMATKACQAGTVKMGGETIKPSRDVRVGDVLSVRKPGLTRTVKVVALLEQRVGAKLVGDYMEDLTPPEEYERHKEERMSSPRTGGRPNKHQRREIQEILNAEEDS